MSRASLLTLLGFVAVTSIVAGSFMVVGTLLGPERLGVAPDMAPPSDLLQGSPFATYLVPGLLLLLVVGGIHLSAFILLIRRHHLAAFVSATAGFSILIWIFVQMVFVPFSILQAVYFGVGLAELGLLLLLLGLIARPLQPGPA